MQDQGLDWGKCVSFCTYRAASMAGYHLGPTAKIKKFANKICCLHIAYIAVNI